MEQPLNNMPMTKRQLFGLIIILMGISLALQSGGWIQDQIVKDSIGSGLVVAIGMVLFLWRRRAWPWAVILVIVGATDFVENQQWAMFEEHTPWEYVWPAFLIVFGVWLMTRQGKTPLPPPAKS